MVKIVPNSEYRNRKGIDLKKVIPQAIERGFTDLVVINEDQKKASIFYRTNFKLLLS